MERSGGISVFGLLGVLFVGLKLGNVITWSWLWVLAPFWGPLAVAVVIALVIAFVAGVHEVGEARRRRSNGGRF